MAKSKCVPDNEKIVIVTGGARGVGLEICRDPLAKRSNTLRHRVPVMAALNGVDGRLPYRSRHLEVRLADRQVDGVFEGGAEIEDLADPRSIHGAASLGQKTVGRKLSHRR